ncbi:MAG: RNA-binding transcriptional accessory protein [Desulfamplus sp.]|nr:RNA-binding transcriptional accessory protein [Desulfamplus sp.]
MNTSIKTISTRLGMDCHQVSRTAQLLEQGDTVPFIARYRKEVTGSLDEVQIAAIRDALGAYAELEKRKKAVIASLQERELLTNDLNKKIEDADNLTLLEDIYLPFRPKRKTRASVAREQGLELLADIIMNRGQSEQEASGYLFSEHGITTLDQALAGARDIVAEKISEDMQTRSILRRIFRKEAIVSSSAVEKSRDQAIKFRDYFDWQEPVSKIAGHRLLALLRGEELKMLKVSIQPLEQRAIDILHSRYNTTGSQTCNQQFILALEDSYRRLLAPSLENELRKELKTRADAEAIEVFSSNLRELLLSAPLGQKRVMALDPGYRTGSKLVCLDEQGDLLHNETVYPATGDKSAQKAADTIKKLVSRHRIEAIAIGNGTAGRETDSFVRSLGLDEAILVTLVNEDGASIYSASETARREFPDHDITVRGAVSIGRRLQDPLAELVKIDPKSIGVGQYQHDVSQNALKKGLEEVVTSCVNKVGVEANSASVELLSYVAGLGSALATNIVSYRQENGPFKSRKELLKVPRLGPKAYEQCAGFLRIRNSANQLDNTGVHPERYDLVKKMAKDHGFEVNDLLVSDSARKKIMLENYHENNVGNETLLDIMAELATPGRDPREKFECFRFDDTVHTMEDLRIGMILPAVITNVTKFGAFADIGIKQDGLIHVSQLADRFVSDPAEVVHVRQQVRVKVLDIDLERKRVGLSLRI